MLFVSYIYLFIGGAILDTLRRVMLRNKRVQYTKTVWVIGGIAVVFLWPLVLLDAVWNTKGKTK